MLNLYRVEREIPKYLREEIFSDPPSSINKIQEINDLLADILRESTSETRKELKALLKRWEIRVLFSEAVQEELDAPDKE